VAAGTFKSLFWPSDALAGASGSTVLTQQVQLTELVLDLDAPALVSAFEQLELSPNQLKLMHELGEGQFGSVHAAVLLPTQTQVAVKSLKGQAGGEAQRKFLTEARILAALKHPHIVRVVGVCFKSTPNLVVVEFMGGGDLCGYLQKHEGSELVRTELLLGALVQIAEAMSLLEKQRIVHRDLAARCDLVVQLEH
jgi:hypothetical protein